MSPRRTVASVALGSPATAAARRRSGDGDDRQAPRRSASLHEPRVACSAVWPCARPCRASWPASTPPCSGCAAALVDEAGAGGHSEDASAMAPPCAATRTRLRRASRGGRRDQPAPQLRSQQLHRRRWPLGPRSVERGQAAILTYTNIKQRPAGAASATGQADGALCASCWRELGSWPAADLRPPRAPSRWRCPGGA